MLKPCNQTKCPNLVEITSSNRTAPCYCVEHLSEYYSRNRSRYPRNKYGPLWERIRASYLYNHKHCECDDPECLVCLGNHNLNGGVLATDVDHVVRFSRWSSPLSAHKHLQALCKKCHSSKTNREVQGRI